MVGPAVPLNPFDSAARSGRGDDARFGPPVAAIERIGRLVRVRMEAESVHQGRGRPSRGTRRRARGGSGSATSSVALRLRLVVPARREPDADDLERGIDGLQGVVGGPGTARRPPQTRSRPTAELWPPERGLIRLVADHDLPHLRVRAGDRRDPAREQAGRAEPGLDLPGRIRIDGENDPEPGVEAFGIALSSRALSWITMGSLGLNRTPITVCPSPTSPSPIQRRAAVGVVLRRVVVGSDVGGRAAVAPARSASEKAAATAFVARLFTRPDGPLEPATRLAP